MMICDDTIYHVFMCNGKRFHVTIKAKNLKGEGNLREEFEAMDSLAPIPAQENRNPITLLDYFSAPIFPFALINKDGVLHAVPEEYDPDLHNDPNPRTQIVDKYPDSPFGPSPCDANSLLLHDMYSDFILRSALPPVPLIPASEVERVEDGLHSYELSDIPRRVQRKGSTEMLYFEPGFKGGGHRREIEMLKKISCSSKFDPPFRISKIVGFVVWDNDPSCLVGLLLEYIDGDNLQWRADDATMEMKMKWINQVEATMKRLHEYGIVWGAVSSYEVIINSDDDAVVTGFRGGYNPKYITCDLNGTIEADWIGFKHMKADILESHGRGGSRASKL
ncbi:kinase-like domain [Fusarium albosuccineum]|uniref:Kinase-like domain n=1 Tax=Fusarium albosuccineum TaxID=1237068 RepID=A0A8H4P4J8_9HYPO|nr:kinase-like domain [Fusarium albosuccineum]